MVARNLDPKTIELILENERHRSELAMAESIKEGAKRKQQEQHVLEKLEPTTNAGYAKRIEKMVKGYGLTAGGIVALSIVAPAAGVVALCVWAPAVAVHAIVRLPSPNWRVVGDLDNRPLITNAVNKVPSGELETWSQELSAQVESLQREIGPRKRILTKATQRARLDSLSTLKKYVDYRISSEGVNLPKKRTEERSRGIEEWTKQERDFVTGDLFYRSERETDPAVRFDFDALKPEKSQERSDARIDGIRALAMEELATSDPNLLHAHHLEPHTVKVRAIADQLRAQRQLGIQPGRGMENDRVFKSILEDNQIRPMPQATGVDQGVVI